jgi:hypothetical protein
VLVRTQFSRARPNTNLLLNRAATTHRLIAHNSKEDTYHTREQLLGYHLECNNHRHYYTRELVMHFSLWRPLALMTGRQYFEQAPN